MKVSLVIRWLLVLAIFAVVVLMQSAYADEPVISYTVQRGDTLWQLAKSRGVTVREILALNPQLADRQDRIYADKDSIKLPRVKHIYPTAAAKTTVSAVVVNAAEACKEFVAEGSVDPADALTTLPLSPPQSAEALALYVSGKGTVIDAPEKMVVLVMSDGVEVRHSVCVPEGTELIQYTLADGTVIVRDIDSGVMGVRAKNIVAGTKLASETHPRSLSSSVPVVNMPTVAKAAPRHHMKRVEPATRYAESTPRFELPSPITEANAGEVRKTSPIESQPVVMSSVGEWITGVGKLMSVNFLALGIWVGALSIATGFAVLQLFAIGRHQENVTVPIQFRPPELFLASIIRYRRRSGR